MNQAIRGALVVFPMGLLIAGCSAAHRYELYPAPAQTFTVHAASAVERGDSSAETGFAPRPTELADRTIATESRYGISLNDIRGPCRKIRP